MAFLAALFWLAVGIAIDVGWAWLAMLTGFFAVLCTALMAVYGRVAVTEDLQRRAARLPRKSVLN